jgi:hypothetical protein
MVMATTLLSGEVAGQAPPIPAEEQPEVLTRGPVNEAFAQPVNFEDRAGFSAPREPPPYIEEIPPAQRPAGGQFAWVPGYWAWDSERDGYIWVSGCWRAVPPDMYWVPGYWARGARDWQWVAGFWAPVGNNAIEYLPAPPELTNVGPPGPPPSPDRMWVPPFYYWHQGQYVQRPGYWIGAQADWVWVPTHYVWTPRGYVLAPGHWDYTLERRGVLFAPVYFPRHVYARPGASYALSIVVDLGGLQLGLFSRPQYNHYYFGDYYDNSYARIGIFPWYEFERRHTWYDPIYVQARWRHHRNEPRWEQHNRQEYDRRRSDASLRPPRTYRELESRLSRMPEPQRRNFEIAAPLERVAARRTTGIEFERSKPEARQQIPKHSREVRKFVEERSQREVRGVDPRAGRPAQEERGPAVRTQETATPAKRIDPAVRSPERIDTAPAERMDRGEQQGRGRQEPRTAPEQQRPRTVAPRETEKPQADQADRGRSGKSQEPAVPGEGKRPEMRPPERMEAPPAARTERGEKPGRDREELRTAPEQQRRTTVTPRETESRQVDKVEVQTSPVAAKRGGDSQRNRPPKQPEDEEKKSRGR